MRSSSLTVRVTKAQIKASAAATVANKAAVSWTHSLFFSLLQDQTALKQSFVWTRNLFVGGFGRRQISLTIRKIIPVQSRRLLFVVHRVWGSGYCLRFCKLFSQSFLHCYKTLFIWFVFFIFLLQFYIILLTRFFLFCSFVRQAQVSLQQTSQPDNSLRTTSIWSAEWGGILNMWFVVKGHSRHWKQILLSGSKMYHYLSLCLITK